MQFSNLVLAFLGVGSAVAHHMATNIYIDGVNQGPGTCMRIPPSTNPVTDVNSNSMACNVGGSNQEAITCAANAGSKITIQWRTWPDASQDGPVDGSHQGPCAVYMKRMGEGGSGSVAGGGWFKIWEDGFHDGRFCTERLRGNGNRMDVIIPSDLAGGYYTFRAEHLALHQGQNVGGAQWYIGCAQLFVYSTGGNSQPKNTVSIPGHVGAHHPGVLFDYWRNMKPSNYKTPGPEPYIKLNSGGGGSPIKVPFSPHNYGECLVKNANWCGVSPGHYASAAGCFNTSANCWKQLGTCYATAPPTGYAGCTQWEKTCAKLQGACKNCNWNGPCSGSVEPVINMRRSLYDRSVRGRRRHRHARIGKIMAHMA